MRRGRCLRHPSANYCMALDARIADPKTMIDCSLKDDQMSA
jgi:hypothetical protein